jgi:hypothetical protein
MLFIRAEEEEPPRIALQQAATKRDESTRRWRIRWTIANEGTRPLTVVAVRLPHGQFKSDARRFEPTLALAPGQSQEFETSVRCDEAQGLATENAFVIFSVFWSGDAWRIFVRIRVMIDSERVPRTSIESVTYQKVGFSGINS